jgi:nucleoid-associated protein YgaU
MTRETKIGLLVGLAFIIVIGILLSDYNRNENQAASLTAVASDVQKGTATLHNGGSTETSIVLPPSHPAPTRPVPTREELRQPTEIVIGPGTSPNAGNDRVATRPPVNDSPFLPPVPPAGPENPAATNTGAGATRDLPRGLRELVNTNSDLTALGAPGHPNTPPTPGTPTGITVNGARQYVAIPGDTVSKLAGRFLGINTKTNREAILAINPSLKQNPNNVIVGHTYMIPPKAGAAPAAPTTPARTVAVAPPAAPEAPHYTYVVKENDNLWKIASEQLGDGNAWAAIKDLNKDILKGGDAVRPNMRLRLPAKPVATIN